MTTDVFVSVRDTVAVAAKKNPLLQELSLSELNFSYALMCHFLLRQVQVTFGKSSAFLF